VDTIQPGRISTSQPERQHLLAKVLGHSDVAVTNLYAHLLPEHLARARNVVSHAPSMGPATVRALARWGSTA
jgi:hypothetical protein